MIEGVPRIILPDISHIRSPEDISHPLGAVAVDFDLGGVKHLYTVSFGDIAKAEEEAIVCPVGDDFQYVHYNEIHGAIGGRYGKEIFAEAYKLAETTVGHPLSLKQRDKPEPLTVGVKTKDGKTILFVNYYMQYHKGKLPPYSEVSQVCTKSVLEKANELGITSVAFPPMGAGTWGATWQESVEGTFMGVHDYLKKHSATKIGRTNTVLFFRPKQEGAELVNNVITNTIAKLK